MEGIFKNVEVNGDNIKIGKDVEGFHFRLQRLDNSDKVVMNLIIPRKDGGDPLWIEFDELIPSWILRKVNINLEEALSIVYNEVDEFECFLEKSVEQFEELLTLEIGCEYDYRIYFSIRYDKQQVSIWDRTLSRESAKGFIRIIEDGESCYGRLV